MTVDRLRASLAGRYPSDRSEWTIGHGRMFFAVNDRQSDIWVMDAVPK